MREQPYGQVPSTTNQHFVKGEVLKKLKSTELPVFASQVLEDLGQFFETEHLNADRYLRIGRARGARATDAHGDRLNPTHEKGEMRHERRAARSPLSLFARSR